MAEIKFCGMTRPADAAFAASLGASYVGVIFAESPRRLDVTSARAVFNAAPAAVTRVGVFGAASIDQITSMAESLSLGVVQLHGDPNGDAIAQLRKRWSGRIWAVRRVVGSELAADVAALFDVADAVVLDARVDGKLGGTGVTLPWATLREPLDALRGGRARLVLAGGLTPMNVATAIGELDPDVVDVSSGVESSVGVKDHDKMRAFRDAALSKAVR